MIYGYARVSTDGQSVDAQVKALRAAGAETVFRETASRVRADRAQLRRAIAKLEKGDVLMVTRLDRLARSTRDLLNTLDAAAKAGAGFRSLGDTWANTTTAHGRLMLTVVGGLAEFERELIPPAPVRGASAPRREAFTWGGHRSSPAISTKRRSVAATREKRPASLRGYSTCRPTPYRGYAHETFQGNRSPRVLRGKGTRTFR